MNKVITISREFGSGGRSIANLVSEALDIPVFDNELLTRIAEESGFAKQYIEDNAENISLSHLISRSLSGLGGYNSVTPEDYLWQSQSKVIIDIAEHEPCVIVGRCADYILREKADCLRVFVYADKDKRARRIVDVYGESPEGDPYARLKEKDKRRSTFYNYHTDMKWGEPHHYNICLDAGTLGLETCAEIITTIYRK